MTKQKETRKLGNPAAAFELFQDLFEAFKKSRLFNGMKNNPLFPFDVLMGISQFTNVVLEALEKSADGNYDFRKIYSEYILPELREPARELVNRTEDIDISDEAIAS